MLFIFYLLGTFSVTWRVILEQHAPSIFDGVSMGTAHIITMGLT